MSVADSSELLQELRGRCDRLPGPHQGWHPYVPLIHACRADLERAVAAAEARPATADLAEAFIAGELELDFDRDSSPELTAAYDRLEALPAPSGRHPYLDEILPTLEGLRTLLVALSRTSGS